VQELDNFDGLSRFEEVKGKLHRKIIRRNSNVLT
jgi:hypothetical protein